MAQEHFGCPVAVAVEQIPWLAKLQAKSQLHGRLRPAGDIVPAWSLVFKLNETIAQHPNSAKLEGER